MVLKVLWFRNSKTSLASEQPSGMQSLLAPSQNPERIFAWSPPGPAEPWQPQQRCFPVFSVPLHSSSNWFFQCCVWFERVTLCSWRTLKIHNAECSVLSLPLEVNVSGLALSPSREESSGWQQSTQELLLVKWNCCSYPLQWVVQLLWILLKLLLTTHHSWIRAFVEK